MQDRNILNRDKMIKELADFGIKEEYVYLIDVIPLIEMMWADGKAQESEIVLLEDYLKKHVNHINELSSYEMISFEDARGFICRFLKNRPDPELLKLLRSLIAPVRLSTTDPEEKQYFLNSLLSACLDIASSSVVKYPYGIHDRFNPEEKKCFFEILKSLT